MALKDIFKKTRTDKGTEMNTQTEEPKQTDHGKAFEEVAPKEIGKLDMVIAFDTTGSMAQYIEAVRKEVSDLIPSLFKDNKDLRLGIVAFGDYCDMNNPQEFGDAYQFIHPTDNENELIKFVKESKDTNGGDGDEFYELVIKKIVEETHWREGSTRSILLIADAEPHPLGYTYGKCIVNNKIDWKEEARKAANMGVKIDTVTITDATWYKELSAMTDGVSVPFKSGYNTGRLMEAAIWSRGSKEDRIKFDRRINECEDVELKNIFNSFMEERKKV